MDDIFLICNDGILALNEFLHGAKSLESNIQFTLEVKQKGSLPFLNIELIRIMQQIK